MNIINKIKEQPIYIRDIFLSGLLIVVLIFHFTKILSGTFDWWLLLVTSIIGVLPIFQSAIISVKEGEWASMDMLASIALLFSLLSGEWPSAIFITLMITSARILDELNEAKAKKSITGLLKLRPENAKVEKDGAIKIIPVEQIQIGDVIVVDNSERIPIDGKIIFGEATVDESSLTGESLPVEKTVGKKVSSSTLVTSGSIKILTEKIGKDTTLEKIIALVQDAREEKPEVENLGALFGKVYLISIFVAAVIILLVSKNIYLVLAVVLVVCADDVAVAIPIAYLRAISIAAGAGIIVKGGKHLEALCSVDTIVFDKTGTLTIGKPVVSVIESVEGFDISEVLKYGSIAAIRSTHPLAKSLISYAVEKKLPEIFPDSADIVGGRGVVALKDGQKIILGNKTFLDSHQISISEDLLEKVSTRSELGESVSYIAVDDKTVGFFAAADQQKENAVHVIKKLEKMGVNIVMLTGDNDKVATAMSAKLGIKKFYANLLPEDKVFRIKELQKTNKVAMVGDGVNDASALSISNVGIAMGALGTDGAIESAEIVLMHDDLAAIPKIIKMARTVHQIAIQDFWIWGITNVLGLTLVFGGVIGHTGAAAYNFISDFFPLFNSLRAKIK